MENWTIDNLLKELEAKKKDGSIFQWTVRNISTDREEAYFIQDKTQTASLDQRRFVQEKLLYVSIEVSKEKKLGAAGKKFFFTNNLHQQVETLIATAHLGEEERWSLQENPPKIPHKNRADPLIWENLGASTEEMGKNLVEAIQNTEQGHFNSAELFVSRDRRELFLSNGFCGENFQTQIYTEVCFSEKNENMAEEFLLTQWSGSSKQMDFPKMCTQSADFAKYSLTKEGPKTGKYAVLLSAADMCPIFSDVLSQLNTRNKYFNTPFMETGKPLIPNFEGHPFSLSLDPEMIHSFGSCLFDSYGDAQKKQVLAKDNQIICNPSEKKFSDYLKKEVTTNQGTVVLEPQQSQSVDSLRKSAPQVLEILQFSGLFTSANDLTFSSEIRLARLYDNEKNTVTYIKGGSLSGKFPTNFSKIRWSDTSTLINVNGMDGRQAYYGPHYSLLNDVNVSA